MEPFLNLQYGLECISHLLLVPVRVNLNKGFKPHAGFHAGGEYSSA